MRSHQSATSNQSSRRDFLNWILNLSIIGWLLSVLYPIYRYIIPPKLAEPEVRSVKLGSVDDFPPDKGQIFKFGNTPGLIIHLPNGEFKAFVARCTHLDCTVQYRSDLKIIWCACHNGKYDLNGINIAGPPPRPLEPLKVIVKNNEIYVTKEA